MSNTQNQNYEQHQKEIADENPFSFENVASELGKATEKIYGINPYEKKEIPIGYFKDKEVEVTNPDN